MSKKRRVFDIEFDEAELDPPKEAAAEVPEEVSPRGHSRRSPMATAISENAQALTDRQQVEAAIRAENDSLAQEYVALKRAGQILRTIPLDLIDMNKLTRDRAALRDPEIDELRRSIEANGLSNPIRVEQAGDRFELIQGYRRLLAFRELSESDPRFAEIPAHVQATGEGLDDLYRKMVDENLVRRGISFAEMAQLAIAYAEDPETPDLTVEEAVDRIYASTSRQKRSHIRYFSVFMREIGHAMQHPEAVPRKLGLDLVKRCEEDGTLSARVVGDIAALKDNSAEAELSVLQGWLSRPKGAAPRRTGGTASARTVMRLARPGGSVARCTVSDGRLELRLDRDFSDLDRAQLEAALEDFMDRLKL